MHIREALQKATSPSLELLRAAESEIYRLDAMLLESESKKPMFYVRLRSDGGYEGPLHADSIEQVRLLSGAWKPLYLGDAPTPRSFLEQFDLDQNEDYRKGYEDGRLRGYEVGLRHGKEQANPAADRRKVQTANHPMRRATDWPRIESETLADQSDQQEGKAQA